MNCKHCNAELETGASVCPVCGEQVKRGNPLVKKILQIGSVVLVIAALLGAVGLSIYLNESRPEGPKTYTASDADVIAAGNNVVATIGNRSLTVQQLQIYYWMEVYSFMDEYASDLTYMGFDYKKPFEEQVCFMDETKSWQEFFLECALESWQQMVAVTLELEKEGFVLDAATREYLDSLPESMEKTAKDAKYDSADEMLSKELGAGVDLEAYMQYISFVQTGSAYFQSVVSKLDPDMAAIEKYFTDNEAYFKKYQVTKDSGDLAGVRHILIIPSGGAEDEDGEVSYSEAEWEACRQKAQELLDGYLAGGKIDEEAFAKLAQEKSQDPGSASNGGLYAAFPKGYMVKPFEEWSFAEGRQYGDTGLVKTSIGYHIMFFVQSQPEWYYYSRSGVVSEMAEEQLNKWQNGVAIQVDYDKILISQVTFS